MIRECDEGMKRLWVIDGIDYCSFASVCDSYQEVHI